MNDGHGAEWRGRGERGGMKDKYVKEWKTGMTKDSRDRGRRYILFTEIERGSKGSHGRAGLGTGATVARLRVELWREGGTTLVLQL